MLGRALLVWLLFLSLPVPSICIALLMISANIFHAHMHSLHWISHKPTKNSARYGHYNHCRITGLPDSCVTPLLRIFSQLILVLFLTFSLSLSLSISSLFFYLSYLNDMKRIRSTHNKRLISPQEEIGQTKTKNGLWEKYLCTKKKRARWRQWRNSRVIRFEQARW